MTFGLLISINVVAVYAGPVSTGMVNRLWEGKPPKLTQPASLATPPCVVAMNTIESWGVNRHPALAMYPWSGRLRYEETEISATLWVRVTACLYSLTVSTWWFYVLCKIRFSNSIAVSRSICLLIEMHLSYVN